MTDNSNSNSNFDALQEKNEQVLNNISNLQNEEKSLYQKLDDNSLTPDDKKMIIDKINEISQMRLNLYSSMNDMYSFYQKNVEASRTTLGQEVSAIDIVENELNEAKKRLNKMDEQRNNKLRMVEINTYYGKMYNSHTKIMKTVVFFCIPVIILAILANMGFLPPKLYMFLVGIVIIICLILIGYQIIDLSNRDNMNWDEYNWYFDPSKAPTDTTETTSSSTSNPWSTISMTCIGSECCSDGLEYDSNKNICVLNTSNDSLETQAKTTESFETGKVLGKYGYSQEKSFPINNMVMTPFASLTNF
jgi:hypothetical protein